MDIVKPLLDVAEAEVLKKFCSPDAVVEDYLFKYIGLYISYFKQKINENIYLFENMLPQKSGWQQQQESKSVEDIFLINQDLDVGRLSTLNEVLKDIIEHVDDLKIFNPFKPVVKVIARQLKKMVELEVAKPDGWVTLSKDKRYLDISMRMVL